MTSGKKSDQSKRFIEAAREIGASEDADVFDSVLGKIAKAPPPETVRERHRSTSPSQGAGTTKRKPK